MSSSVEANLAMFNERFHEYVDGKLGVGLPSDAPCYVRFWRLLKPGSDGVEGLAGWVLEIDLFIHGLKFYVRWSHPGLDVKLMVQEPDGSKELVGEWTRE